MESEDFDFDGEYEKLREKFGLPELGALEEDFDVEKVGEKKSEFLVREIRRVMSEKLSLYLHFFETLINPGASPMFVFSLIRGIDEEGKVKIKELYKKLSVTQIDSMKLDVIYSEDGEVEFVKRVFEMWQVLKKEIFAIIEKVGEDFGKENGVEKRGYFG